LTVGAAATTEVEDRTTNERRFACRATVRTGKVGSRRARRMSLTLRSGGVR
jgi:hypothetical protein